MRHAGATAIVGKGCDATAPSCLRTVTTETADPGRLRPLAAQPGAGAPTRRIDPGLDFVRVEAEQMAPLDEGDAALEDEAPHVANLDTEATCHGRDVPERLSLVVCRHPGPSASLVWNRVRASRRAQLLDPGQPRFRSGGRWTRDGRAWTADGYRAPVATGAALGPAVASGRRRWQRPDSSGESAGIGVPVRSRSAVVSAVGPDIHIAAAGIPG